MKVMNPEYDRIPCVPVEVALRDQIGRSLDTDQLETADEAVRELLENREAYRRSIEQAMEQSLFNLGHSAEVGARYILDAVQKKAGRG